MRKKEKTRARQEETHTHPQQPALFSGSGLPTSPAPRMGALGKSPVLNALRALRDPTLGSMLLQHTPQHWEAVPGSGMT